MPFGLSIKYESFFTKPRLSSLTCAAYCNIKAGQWRQLEDSNDAIAIRETMPLQIKGNNAIVTRATTPSQQQQGRLCTYNSNNSIVIRAKIAIATMAKTCLLMATMPLQLG
jgi:hypothetical protein